MLQVRRGNDRGHFDHGWLDTFHTFSFADYYDPAHHHFRSLRVINEDRVAPGQGFGMHGHRDMEIVTIVLEGALQHRDSLGHGAVLRPGEIQHMSAGTGIEHSEFNPSPTEPVHLYQIWLFPRARGLTPRYDQKALDPAGRQNRLQPIATPDGRDGSLAIEQDAHLFLADLTGQATVAHSLAAGRAAWVQILRGDATVDGVPLHAGDGAAITDQALVEIQAAHHAEVLLFDLA